MRHSAGLKAYTIMDVLLGMVVSSLVISIVFFLFTSVSKQNHDFQQVRVELNAYLIMNNVLNRDIDQAEEIYAMPNGFVLENTTTSINYQLKENQLIRATEQSEEVLFENCTELVSEKYKESALIAQLNLKIKIQEREIVCHYHKEYDQAAVINQLLINGN